MDLTEAATQAQKTYALRTAHIRARTDLSDEGRKAHLAREYSAHKAAMKELRTAQVAEADKHRAETSGTGPIPAPRPDTGAASPQQLTTAQAAAELRMSPRHVVRLVHSGQLLSTRLGRSHLLDPDEVHRYRTRRAS